MLMGVTAERSAQGSRGRTKTAEILALNKQTCEVIEQLFTEGWNSASGTKSSS